METIQNHFFSDMSVMLGRSMRHIFRSMDTIITVTDHAYCDDVAVRVCVRRRHSNRDSELCQLHITWDLTDCDCERDILYGFPFVYRCATGDR